MNAREASYKLQVARTLLGTGMLQPVRADKAVRSLAALRRWGPTAAAAYIGAAIRQPQSTALVDERGTLSFSQVNRRTNALAHELRQIGVGEQDAVAIMCRNHRGFVEATVACSKLGASGLYLNTAFAGPQIADVLEREDPVALIYDEEFTELVAAGSIESGCLRAAPFGVPVVPEVRITVRPGSAGAFSSASSPAAISSSSRGSLALAPGWLQAMMRARSAPPAATSSVNSSS